MRAAHGQLVLLAETFVDRSRFTGACYRAANWQVLGQTQGFARKPGTPATWVPHGRPKEVLVYPLARDAREQLRALDDAPAWRSQGDPEPWTTSRLRSLFECLRTVPEFRGTRGRRYPLATILAIAVAAKLAGYHGTRAFAEFASTLTQHQLRALRAFYSHRLGRFTAPTTTAFLQCSGRASTPMCWTAPRAPGPRSKTAATSRWPIDGKRIRGAARHNPAGKHHLVAAVEHLSGKVLGQEAVAHKSNEIPAVRTLTLGLDLKGRVVTVDAMHVQHDTAPVRGRAVRRALRDDPRSNPTNPTCSSTSPGSTGSVPRCAPPSTEPRTRGTDASRSEAAGCSTSPTTPTPPLCPIARWRFASSASGETSRPARSSTRPYTA